MDYIEVSEAIMSRRRFTSVSGREVSEELLSRLGHPESGVRIIQIAGTNGKGSTAAFVSSILQAAGFCVGMFTSPHLVRFTERIRVNGVEISEEDAARLGQNVLGTPMSNDPTMFDLCLAMALLYFSEKKCDYVVLEAGLGGRLDSTAGIGAVPLVTVITRIGLDHTAYLGDTLPAIAGEKAGILRHGTRCVIGESAPEAEAVIEEACKRLEISYVYAHDAKIPEGADLGLFGLYQRENAGNAIAAVRELYEAERERAETVADFGAEGSKEGRPDATSLDAIASEAALRRGLRDVVWQGRMQIISRDPFLILDGAHNPQGIRALSDSLAAGWQGELFIIVMGVLADKDYRDMIAPLVALSDRFIATSVTGMPRALPAEALAEVIRSAGGSAQAIEAPRDALSEALREARESGLKVVACGSLYMIGELIYEYERGL